MTKFFPPDFLWEEERCPSWNYKTVIQLLRIREFSKVAKIIFWQKSMMMVKTLRQQLRWKAVENVGNCMLQAAKLGRIVINSIRICGRRRIWVSAQLKLQSACTWTSDADLFSRDLVCCWWGSLLFRNNPIAFSCINFFYSFALIHQNQVLGSIPEETNNGVRWFWASLGGDNT